MNESRYLKLLWLYVALILATVVASFFPTYSDNLATAYRAEPETWLFRHYWLAVSAAAVFALAWLFGLIGLFFFKKWARTLSSMMTIAGFLMHPLIGVSLNSGFESALIEASATLWGVILALTYFSALSEKFER